MREKRYQLKKCHFFKKPNLKFYFFLKRSFVSYGRDNCFFGSDIRNLVFDGIIHFRSPEYKNYSFSVWSGDLCVTLIRNNSITINSKKLKIGILSII